MVDFWNDTAFQYNKLDLYDKTQAFHFWLRRIIINTAIDYYRYKQRQPLFIAIDNVMQSLVGGNID